MSRPPLDQLDAFVIAARLGNLTRAAEAMIDFVYEVDNAARLAVFIYYISPVKGVAETIAATDTELAANPLLFPPADVTAIQYPQPDLTDEEDLAFTEMMDELEGN